MSKAWIFNFHFKEKKIDTIGRNFEVEGVEFLEHRNMIDTWFLKDDHEWELAMDYQNHSLYFQRGLESGEGA